MRSFVLLAAFVLVLTGAWWLTCSPRVASDAGEAQDEAEASERASAAFELVRAEAPVTPAVQPTDSARAAVSAEAPRSLLHGHFVALDGVTPLAASLLLLIAAPGNSVAESLRSKPDGSFVSTRRFPLGTLKVWLRDPQSGAELAQHESSFDPATGDWLVPVKLPEQAARVEASATDETTLSGQVVDLEGQAVSGALVRLLPREHTSARSETGAEPLQDATGAAGAFRFAPLDEGSYRLLVFGRFARAEPVVVEVHAGWNELDPLVLPIESSPGAIRGSLVAENGEDDPFAVLALRDLASGKELGVATDLQLDFFGNEHVEDGQTPFTIQGLPPGRYELSVVALDGRVYEPRSLLVSPPAEGLEFRSHSSQLAYGLRVRAADSGEELANFTTLGCIHGQWLGGNGQSGDKCFTASFERWIVCSSGFHSARGDFSRALPTKPAGEDDLRLVDVGLEHGWSVPVLFKDAESDSTLLQDDDDGMFGTPLTGVRVLADGVLASTSDRDGLAVLDLARAPARIDYALDGWGVAWERVVEDVRIVWMARR